MNPVRRNDFPAPRSTSTGALLRGVVSGGQTGVDRAALDVANDLGLRRCGWCPRNRLAEDGIIPSHHPLRETLSDDPAERTSWNVFDSDATLIFGARPLVGGTALAASVAERFGRPLLIVDPLAPDPEAALRWLDNLPRPLLLNVAGPRESEIPGIYAGARTFLEELLTAAVDLNRTAAAPLRRALLTGGAGLLGRWLRRLTPPGWELHWTVRTNDQIAGDHCHAVELSDPSDVRDCVRAVTPDLILHTAYSVEYAERDIWQATRNVADSATGIGADLVHLSSDMVLDGSHAPYDEAARTSPINDYGAWKARAEEFILRRCPSAAIIRLSLIVDFEAPDPRTAWVLEGLRGTRDVQLYVDELRTPILASDLARQVWEIVRLPVERRRGIWNLAAPESLSRYALGLIIAAAFGLNPDALEPTRTPTETPRPHDLRLLTRRADRELLTRARSLSSAAADFRSRHSQTINR